MKKAIGIILVLSVMGCKGKSQEQTAEDPGAGTQEQKTAPESQWTVLFDGSSFDGWHFYNGGEVGEPWTLGGGARGRTPPCERPEGTIYNLVTDAECTNFGLQLEGNIAGGGNSGIFWGVKEGDSLKQPYLTGPELQVLDDERH